MCDSHGLPRGVCYGYEQCSVHKPILRLPALKPPNGLPITRAERAFFASEGTAAGRVSDRSGGGFIGLLCSWSVSERILLGMFQRFQFEINIQVGPVQMFSVQQLDLQHGRYLCFPEPGECFERQEVFLAARMQPETVFRDADNLNCRGAFSKRQ